MHDEPNGGVPFGKAGSLLEVVGFWILRRILQFTKDREGGGGGVFDSGEWRWVSIPLGGCGWVTPDLIDPPLLLPSKIVVLLVRLGNNWGKTGSRRWLRSSQTFRDNSSACDGGYDFICGPSFVNPVFVGLSRLTSPWRWRLLRAGGCWTPKLEETDL